MSAQAIPTLLTVGVIAERFGVPVHRIAYIVDSRGISPVGRAGSAYIYTEASVQRIESELRRISEDREGTQ